MNSILEIKTQLEDLNLDISQKLLMVKSIEKDLIQQEKNIEYASHVISDKLGNNVESDKFLNFFKKPYVTTLNGKNSILVFVPKFIKGFQVGWLHREDKRESYIFALTGFPIGLNWQEYMEKVGKSYFPVEVMTVKHDSQKMAMVDQLIDNKKTIIFCDSIELGKKISNHLNIPFVYGETSNRIEIIKENNHVVVSRVGDLGISIDNLQRIIEVDFLFGSRQQELQRLGRLMHSKEKDLKHYIIMTEEELAKHSKRLWALREKGFNVRISSK